MTLGCKKRADHKAWQSRVISLFPSPVGAFLLPRIDNFDENVVS